MSRVTSWFLVAATASACSIVATPSSAPSERDARPATPAKKSRPAVEVAAAAAAPAAQTQTARLFVAWSPQDLPRRTERELDEMKGVRATTVRSGLDWMTSSRRPDGRVQTAPAGYAIPIEVAIVEPWEYSRLVARDDRARIRGLREGGVVLSRAAADVRGGDRGLRLRMEGRTVKVRGVIGNRTAQGYEMLMRPPLPATWSGAVRFVILEAAGPVTRKDIKRTIRRSLPAGHGFKLSSERDVPFLRYADAVRPNVMIKRNFGEFSARRLDNGALELYPPWRAKHIVRDQVPILGSVTCHSNLFRMLRGALRTIRERGLAHLVRTDQYAGCFAARFTSLQRGSRISRHTWGIAIDINTSGNCLGCEPHQDPRLVRIFQNWGFTWGGRWVIPDGMHFEWYRFPR